jgi:hypothetical protein
MTLRKQENKMEILNIMATITVKLVMDNGRVDSGASVEAFEAELSKFVAAHETELSSVASAVSAVFDEHLGHSINMPTLSALTAMRLNAQPSNFGALSELVLDYVRADAKSASPTYTIRKGKAGGVARIADIVAPPAK